MRRRTPVLLYTSVVVLTASAIYGAAFTAGDLVIYRVGDTATGTALSNSSAPVYLDEYNPLTHALVQSIPMPTVDSGSGNNHALTGSGSAVSEGMLNLSPDGQYLTFTGYNTGPGTTQVLSSPVARTVGIIAADGVVNTTTALTDFAVGDNPRSAVTSNGTDLWVAGGSANSTNSGGVRHAVVGGSSSGVITSDPSQKLSDVSIAGGKLYVSSNAGSSTIASTFRLGTVGTGLPTSGAFTLSNLAGITATTDNALDSYFFADVNSTPGIDTLYVADETSGIHKFVLSNGTWAARGIIGSATNLFRGITGIVTTGNLVTIYATEGALDGTQAGGTVGGGKLVTFTDASGFGGTMSSSLPITTIAIAGDDEAFRGVSFVPVAVPEPSAFLSLLAGIVGLVSWSRFRKLGSA